MSLRSFISRLTAIARRRAIDAELAEEIEAHLRLAADEKIAAGIAPDAAYAGARREFGNPTLARESSGARWGWPALDQLSIDARFGVRMLRRNARSSAAAIGALGIAVGATAAVVSLFAAVLYHRYPYAEAERLALVWAARTTPPKYDEMQVSLPEVREWQRLARQGSIAAFSWTQSLNVQTARFTERVAGSVVTDNLLSVLGVKPIWGRGFTAADANDDAPNVALITYDFWQNALGGDAGALSRPLIIDRQPYAIIGVTPPGFAVPILQKVKILLPPPRARWATDRMSRSVVPIARLASGASLASLKAELAPISSQWNDADPGERGHWAVHPESYAASVRRYVQRTLNGLFGMSVAVLVIACVNVAILLLARVPARRQELMIRLALGAGPSRLVAQMLVEGALMTAAAAAIGIVVARPTLVLLARLFDGMLPFDWSPVLDLRVIGIAAGIATLTCLGFGVAPALSVVGSLRGEAALNVTRTSGARTREWMRGALLMAEVSLSVVLMVAGWLMLESSRMLDGRRFAFESKDMVTARISLDTTRYRTPAAQLAFFQALTSRLSAHAELRDVTMATNFPLGNTDGFANYIGRESGEADTLIAGGTVVLSTYFSALHIPIVYGRALLDRENDPVIVINERLADQLWPGQDPVGKRLRVLAPMYTDGESIAPGERTVVGVSRNVRPSPLIAEDAWPTFFLPFSQQPTRTLTVALRAATPTVAASAVRAEVRALDPGLPVFGIKTVDELMEYWLSTTHMNAVMLDGLAVLGVLLTMVGIYSIVAVFVSQRTREIGIRIAVGARPVAVLGMIARRTLWPAAAGLVVGSALAIAGTRVIAFMLHGISPLQPRAFVVANIALVVTVAFAACIPALVATRVDPVRALRSD